jgi:hypothetical protein
MLSALPAGAAPVQAWAIGQALAGRLAGCRYSPLCCRR